MTPDFRRLLTVILLGLVARLAVIAPSFGSLDDPDMYLPIARSLARGRDFCIWEGVPTANRPPLYPILLAPIVGLFPERNLAFGIGALHILIGLGTIALTYLVARRWGYGPDRAAMAAAIVALDPVMLVQVRPVMTETLAAGLVAACLASLALERPRGVFLSGLLFGLAALCRPSLLPGAALVGMARWMTGPGELRRRTIEGLAFLLGVVMPFVPWTARNLIRFDEPIVTTTHGGYTLALANNPMYYADVVDGPPGAVWSGPNQQAWFDWVERSTNGMTPAQADRFLGSEGWRMLRERPVTFVRASLARLGRFWGVAPSGAVYSRALRTVTAAWTVPLWIALILGTLRRDLWRWAAAGAPLMVVGLMFVHMVFWTDMRMRVPVVPAIAVIAAGAGIPPGKRGDDRRISAGQNAGNR